MRAVRCVYCKTTLADKSDEDLVAIVEGHFALVCMKPIAIAAGQ